jgi:hypothetical protein
MAKKKEPDSPRYDPDYHPEHAAKFCLMGATNVKLAQLFEVAESTIESWLQKHRDFRTAVMEGRELADAEVAHALHRRAVGYAHKATKFFQYEGDVIAQDYTERYPPDTNAGKFWLMNRQGWKEKSEQVTQGGDKPVIHEIRRVIVDPKPRDR